MASLNMAVTFAQALTGSMSVLTQLLASSTASDVQVCCLPALELRASVCFADPVLYWCWPGAVLVHYM